MSPIATQIVVGLVIAAALAFATWAAFMMVSLAAIFFYVFTADAFEVMNFTARMDNLRERLAAQVETRKAARLNGMICVNWNPIHFLSCKFAHESTIPHYVRYALYLVQHAPIYTAFAVFVVSGLYIATH